MAAAKGKKAATTEAAKVNANDLDRTEVQAEQKQRIVLKKDTEFRKFPTLQKEHVEGVGRAGTGYTIVDTIGGIYGWFYKLNNGKYIVKNDANYTIV